MLEFAQHFGLWLDSLNKLLLYNYLNFNVLFDIQIS